MDDDAPINLILVGVGVVALFWAVVVRKVMEIARPEMLREASAADEELQAKKRAEEDKWYLDTTLAKPADVKEAQTITMNSLRVEAESIRALDRAGSNVRVGKPTPEQLAASRLRASLVARFEETASRIEAAVGRGELTLGLCRSAKRMFVDRAQLWQGAVAPS